MTSPDLRPDTRVETPPVRQVAPWWIAGVVAGYLGLAVAYLAARLLDATDDPVSGVANAIIRRTPGGAVEWAIQSFGHHDKLVLVIGILVVLTAVFAGLGVLAERSLGAAVGGFVVLAAIGGLALAVQRDAGALDQLPVVAGFLAWSFALSVVTEPMRLAAVADSYDPSLEASGDAATRRSFLIRAGIVAGLAAFGGVVGRLSGRGRQQVEQARKLLRLEQVSAPKQPAGVHPDVPGLAPWQTPTDDFYVIHTVFSPPTITPAEWSLRIHGMVEREITLTFDELLAREFTEDWITLNCVSNEVGGSLIGNAWWSGVRIAPILAEAGVSPDADCVLQTSRDGWNCSTPLAALTDDRNAMLAVAMNGQPLPVDHGFPVRTIVPGLYGYVSGTKWVVDYEVTRFDQVDAYWTMRGWGEKGPVKISSRIDVPRDGETLPAGEVTIAGEAWLQHTGISRVEIAVDGGSWQQAELAAAAGIDSWVQWSTRVELAEGEHTVKVRAVDADGAVQTSVVRSVLPDGATGLHERTFRVGA